MTKAEATRRGKQLLRRMDGVGWELQVWENNGWYYSVKNHWLNISPDREGTFYSLLADHDQSAGGAIQWLYVKRHKDPNVLAQRQMQQAWDYISRMYAGLWITHERLHSVKTPQKKGNHT